MNELEPNTYPHVLAELKQIVKQARQKAVFAANEQVLKLYRNIGQSVAQQAKENLWGAKIIEKLANDLRSEFPDMKGFSFRNVKYMRQFAEFYTISQFGQQAVAQIPWGHHVLIMDKDQETALYQ
jgi:predicted nuclease of restriction endonuclease-like (RecB) superfamily